MLVLLRLEILVGLPMPKVQLQVLGSKGHYVPAPEDEDLVF